MSYGKGPRLVSYNLGHESYEYLLRLVDLGLIQGELGAMQINPNLTEVIQALHHVAAGGTVKVQIDRPGHPDIVKELNDKFAGAQDEANEINKKMGFYMTVT